MEKIRQSGDRSVASGSDKHFFRELSGHQLPPS